MKIVYCIAGTYRSGGMERVLANKANYFSNLGHEVTIVTTDQRGQKPFFQHHPSISHVDLGINYEENNGKSFFNKLRHYPSKQRLHRERLENLLFNIKADIVVSMFCNDVSFITKIKDGSKKVLEIHFSKWKRLQYGRKGLWYLADWFQTKLDERRVARFNRFVVLTREDKGYWGDLPNIVVIPNSIYSFPEKVSSLEHKEVVAIGRYTYQKGFDRLLNIWRKVVDQEQSWHLNIVGDGELRAQLTSQVEKLSLQNHVTLSFPTNEIEKVYLKSSILALTSRYEGLPMILIEAQSYGLPVVSYTCQCGPKDVITDGKDGYLVDEGDEEGFVQRLLELMKDTEKRKDFGKVARESSQRFDNETIMSQWLDLFSSLHSESEA